jgi:ribosomal-protein-alanine N-acetyltransferase
MRSKIKKEQTMEAKSGFQQLETNRLFLREFRPEDSEAIFQLYEDSQVTEHVMEPINTPQQAEAIVQEYMAYFQTGKGIVWAITLKGSTTVIGTCGYEVISAYDKRGEIGYDLGKAYWGQGLMKEALKAVIDYSFSTMDLNRIQAYVLLENDRSINLLKKIHFNNEGLLREYRWFKGGFSDWTLMSLLKKDWLSPKNTECNDMPS